MQFGVGSTGTPVGMRLERGGTGIGIADAASNRNRGTVAEQTTYSNANNTVRLATSQFLDSPNTTSATTYNIKSYIYDYGSSITSKNLIVNGGGYAYNNQETAVTSSSVTLTEIGA